MDASCWPQGPEEREQRDSVCLKNFDRDVHWCASDLNHALMPA